jgi:hypothetical protein
VRVVLEQETRLFAGLQEMEGENGTPLLGTCLNILEILLCMSTLFFILLYFILLYFILFYFI